MKRYSLALDLIDDAESIRTYEEHHKAVWPEVLESIRSAGIETLEIFRTGNRLFMLMEVNDTFSFEAKARADASNEKVCDWEHLMWRYQKALPWAEAGAKWILMDKIFELK